ncbi:leucine-rich repeat and WD repeat-containing protein 1 isoform X2 [Mugil cephalus]|uniref:leucine-rich repeat and WD repeat-containing protein 1 isoform X2 n=1 Tax=Mugil cephalus TaxID=48193 RepID=UPI001FB72D51|nr:leucine-rich repeat and WD repeat-containing protein 1 isoform X2 [Mugil cephalus]
MEKITEKVLLEKGSPKTNKLEQIKTLDLSKMTLKLEDLPVKLLSRLQSLERWDLSGNRLQEFPKKLRLPALRCLDLSDNQMEDVTSLESLSSVEELKMDNNLYITVSDNYKLMVLLPNLRIFNSKDVSTHANHLRYVYSDNLRTRINALWEKSFSLPDPVTEAKMSDLETNFISAACQQVKYGPNSVADFTRWRVEMLAKEFMRSLKEPQEDAENRKSADTKENADASTLAERMQTESAADARVNVKPLKRLHSDVPASPAEESPRKSSRRVRPLIETNATRMSPRKANQAPPTPARGQARARGDEARSKEDRAQATSPEAKLQDGANQPVSLKPLHVLQCHSKQDSSEDFSTQLWACAFQPLPDSSGSGGGSRLVATCGGESLCVIDCETGMVMKKYKVPGEEFFSLAWSTVLMSREGKAPAQHCSILAAGGKRGLVKLIHPRNNMAYGEFRASRKSLSVLRFSHNQGNFLFTGSYDNKILMWDIGGVDSQYNFKVVQLMVLEVGATPLHICLPPTSPNTHLLSASENGLLCYSTKLGNNTTTKRSKEMEITFPIYKKENKNHDYHTIDGLSFLNNDIVASKNYMHPSIYLWSWSRTKAQRPDKKNLTVSAVVLAELQWASTDIPYLALNTCPGQAYIVCGDDQGRLWTYHVTNLQKNSFQSGKPIPPTEVLAWPNPTRNGLGHVEGPSINSVAMDPELRYLVALSDKNMVIVWKRQE